jgi:hypothetical protein
MRVLAPVCLFAVLTASPIHAYAQATEPAPEEASLLSGRTLDAGETMMGAALGWPGFWAQVELAPSSDVNIGVRGAVVYGSPVMSLASGAGGELTIPIRIHVFEEAHLDISLRVAPVAAFGEGRLFGAGNTAFANRLGISSRVEFGVLLGYRAAERFTIFFGAHGAPGLSYLEDKDARAIGVFYGAIGVEALMSLETMLFAELEGGIGVADGSGLTFAFYPQREILRLSLGMAYVL